MPPVYYYFLYRKLFQFFSSLPIDFIGDINVCTFYTLSQEIFSFRFRSRTPNLLTLLRFFRIVT